MTVEVGIGFCPLVTRLKLASAGMRHVFVREPLLRRLQVAFEELLSRIPDMEFAEGGPVIVPSSLVRTCARLEVKFTPWQPEACGMQLRSAKQASTCPS